MTGATAWTCLRRGCSVESRNISAGLNSIFFSGRVEHGTHGWQGLNWRAAINVERLLHARSCFGSRESPRALRLLRALTRRSRLCSWDIRRKDANTCALRNQEVAVVACARRSGKMADPLVVRSDGEHSLAASGPLRRTVTLIAVQPPARVFNPQAHRVNNPWRLLPLQTKRQLMHVRLNTFYDRL